MFDIIVPTPDDSNFQIESGRIHTHDLHIIIFRRFFFF